MDSDTERWKSLDAASYNGVAKQFDAHSHRLAYPVAARLVELAALRAGERAMDVGTGTGMVPFEVARVAPAGCSIVGVDISTGMIEMARRNAERRGLPPSRVAFRQMDAEALDTRDGEYDVMLSAFALGHMPNPERAVDEMFRALRPGGRLLITVGSRPPLFSVSTITHSLAELRRRAQALRGRRRSSDLLDAVVDRRLPPETGQPEGSPLATQLSRAKPLATLLQSSGFIGIEQTWQNYQNEIATVDEFWDMQRTICTRARKRLLDAPDALVETVKGEFEALCQSTLRRGGHLVFPISAVFVSGRKPG